MNIAPRVGTAERFFIANCSGDTFTHDCSGAIAIHSYQVARTARAAGYQPVVLTRKGRGLPLTLPDTHFLRWPAPTTRVGKRLRRYGEPVLKRWFPTDHQIFAARLVRQIKRYPPPYRVLFGNDIEVLIAVRDRLPNARLVHVFHNDFPAKDGNLVRAFAASADALTAVSAFTAKECATIWGADVGVAYNGVDLEAFMPPSSKPIGEPPLIGFTGTFSPVKGLDLLLDAAAELQRLGTSARLRLVGDFYWGMEGVEEYAEKVRSQIEELRRSGSDVEVMGRLSREDLAARSPEVDIAVVPSRWQEPFALVLAEGMACGSAVLAARVGGMPEVLGDAGLYFEPDDLSSLVRQLRVLIDQPDLRRRLGEFARVRAERFSWSATWAQLQPLLFP